MPYRFPVVTINISKDKCSNVVDNEFLDYIIKLDIYRYNLFTSEGQKVASCCRLLSDSEMLGMASQANSFGGSSVSLGSHRVVTINFNRIANECKSYEDYIRLIRDRTEMSAKILSSHKKLIKLLESQGLQPFITEGWINLNRMFSTFGVLGLYEADITIKERFGVVIDIIAESLSILNDCVKEFSSIYGIIGNIEQIPAESFAVRAVDSDKILFGDHAIPYELYANQFTPLWEDTTIWAKMEQDGKYNKLITGGGIVHVQISERVTPLQAKRIIEFSMKSGCEHFSLNSVYSECVNGHTTFGKRSICPVCGEAVCDYYTRVVGFFVPVSSWNKTRRTWEFSRRRFLDVS
jgi:ribonucleoside-triphosphate reductase